MDVSPLHLSGHLTPGAGGAAGRVHTVPAHGAFDAVALPHGDPHGHGDGRDAAEDVQQGETETLAIIPGSSTGEAGTTPESKATLRHVLTAVTDS